MNNGLKMMIIINAVSEPKIVKINASKPLPSFSIWCPGRIERKESSSGAPKKILGIKSKNVCVIDIETMKTANAINGIPAKKPIEVVRRAATRFMWIPGDKPVIVPIIKPARRARMISISILIYSSVDFNILKTHLFLINNFINSEYYVLIEGGGWWQKQIWVILLEDGPFF